MELAVQGKVDMVRLWSPSHRLCRWMLPLLLGLHRRRQILRWWRPGRSILQDDLSQEIQWPKRWWLFKSNYVFLPGLEQAYGPKRPTSACEASWQGQSEASPHQKKMRYHQRRSSSWPSRTNHMKSQMLCKVNHMKSQMLCKVSPSHHPRRHPLRKEAPNHLHHPLRAHRHQGHPRHPKSLSNPRLQMPQTKDRRPPRPPKAPRPLNPLSMLDVVDPLRWLRRGQHHRAHPQALPRPICDAWSVNSRMQSAITNALRMIATAWLCRTWNSRRKTWHCMRSFVPCKRMAAEHADMAWWAKCRAALQHVVVTYHSYVQALLVSELLRIAVLFWRNRYISGW